MSIVGYVLIVSKYLYRVTKYLYRVYLYRVTKCVDSDYGVKQKKQIKFYLTLSPPSKISRSAVD
jgi:hypothetical protein